MIRSPVRARRPQKGVRGLIGGATGGLPSTATVTFGSLTGVGRGGVAVPLPDGTYGPITVSGGVAAPNQSLALDADTDRQFGDLRLIVPPEPFHSVADALEIDTVFSAMGLAEGGVIQARNGSYGSTPIDLSGRRFTSLVTVRPDSYRAAKFPGLILNESDNILIHQIDLDRPFSGSAGQVVDATGADDCIIRDCEVHSTPLRTIEIRYGTGTGPGGNGIEPIETLAGIVTSGAQNAGNGAERFVVEDCDIHDITAAWTCEGENLVYRRNTVTDFVSNPWQLIGFVPGARIEDNFMKGAWGRGDDPGDVHSGLSGMANITTVNSPGIKVLRNYAAVGDNRFVQTGVHGSARGLGADEAMVPGQWLTDYECIGNIIFQNLGQSIWRRIESGVVAHNLILYDHVDPARSGNNLIQIEDVGPGFKIYGNAGAVVELNGAGIDPAVRLNQYANVTVHNNERENAEYLFDDPDLTTITAADYIARLTPPANRVLLQGKVKSGPFGHAIDHANNTMTLPAYAPPVTSTATGAEPPSVQFAADTDFDVTFTGFGGSSQFTIDMTFSLEGIADGQAVGFLSGTSFFLHRLTSNLINLVMYDVANGIILNVVFNEPFVASDGWTRLVITGDFATAELTVRKNDHEIGDDAITAGKLGSVLDRTQTTLKIGKFGATYFAARIRSLWLSDQRIDVITDAGLDVWACLDGNPPVRGAQGLTGGITPLVHVEGNAAAWNDGTANQIAGSTLTRNGAAVTDVVGYVPEPINFSPTSYTGDLALTRGDSFVVAAQIEITNNAADFYMFGNISNATIHYRAGDDRVTGRPEDQNGAGITLVSTSQFPNVGDKISVFLRARMIDGSTTLRELWINGEKEAENNIWYNLTNFLQPDYINTHDGAGANAGTWRLNGRLWIGNSGGDVLTYADFFDPTTHEPLNGDATVAGHTAVFCQDTVAGFNAGINNGSDGNFTMFGTVT